MPHSFAANATVSNFHPASVTNHPLVFHAPVFSTRAFPVLLRAKDFFAHEPIFFGTVCTVINSLRFFYLAK